MCELVLAYVCDSVSVYHGWNVQILYQSYPRVKNHVFKLIISPSQFHFCLELFICSSPPSLYHRTLCAITAIFFIAHWYFPISCVIYSLLFLLLQYNSSRSVQVYNYYSVIFILSRLILIIITIMSRDLLLFDHVVCVCFLISVTLALTDILWCVYYTTQGRWKFPPKVEVGKMFLYECQGAVSHLIWREGGEREREHPYLNKIITHN